MALTKPALKGVTYGSGSGGLELFTSTDIYRYDIDNRPLENLSDNDVAVKASIDLIVDEIELAYTGKTWPTGGANTFTSLDGRLDELDVGVGQFFNVRNVQYSTFMSNVLFLAERYTSGFLNGPFPDTFIRANASTESAKYMPSPIGGYFVPEAVPTDKICLETRINQEATPTRRPLYVLIKGLLVPLYNAHGGDSNTVGEDGAVTINFTAAPTGVGTHRFDMSFLEVWLATSAAATPVLYCYGSQDYRDSVTSEIIDDSPDGIIQAFTSSTTGSLPEFRAIWPNSVSIEATVSSAPVTITDDGSGNLAGTNVTGTINYTTGVWALTWSSGAPDNATDIIADYMYAAVADSTDARLIGTLSFVDTGEYLQIQHRIRVVSDVDYATYPRWMDDPDVLGQGGKTSPEATYVFTNGEEKFHDGVLWYAGDGSASSQTALNTFDGYVYAIPLCALSRYNQQTWSITEQNGGASRPDADTHDRVVEDRFLDLRPVVFTETYTMDRAANITLDRILRGKHKTVFNQPLYDYDDNGTFETAVNWGAQVNEIWQLHKTGQALTQYTNTFRDIGLAATESATAPVAFTDGVRRLWSPQEEIQQVEIVITDVDNSTTVTPAVICTYNNSTKVLTLDTNSSSVSGYPGTIINDLIPRLYWRGTRQPVIMSSQWSGLGTKTATCTLDDSALNYITAGTVDGYFSVLYPADTGIDKPVDYITYAKMNDGAADYPTIAMGNSDASPASMIEAEASSALYDTPLGIDVTTTSVYVCDATNARIVKMSYDSMTYQGQYPVIANYPPGTFSATIHLRYPADIAVDSSGNIYIADRNAHRVVKLNSSFIYQGQFGATDTAGTDNSHLDSPEGVAVDSSGNVYISDTGNYRVIKLTSGLVYSSQYGQTGKRGNATDTLLQPTGLHIGEDGYLYIADKVRVHQIDTSDMTAATIMGSGLSEELNSFYNNIIAEDYVAFYLRENAAGDKYITWGKSHLILKLDSNWEFEASFGEYNVALADPANDYDHLCGYPMDSVYHELNDVLLVTDHIQAGNPVHYARILVLDGADLSYIDEYDCGVDIPQGVALYENAPVHNLYICLDNYPNPEAPGFQAKVRKVDISSDPEDPSVWSTTWEKDNYDGTNKLKHLHDIDVDATDTYVFACDNILSMLVKLDASNGAHVGVLGSWDTWPPSVDGTSGGPLSVNWYSTTVMICTNHTDGTLWEVDPKATAIAPTKTAEHSDPANWGDDRPLTCSFNAAKTKLYVVLSTTILVYEWPLGASTLAQKYLYDVMEVPYVEELELNYPWLNVRAVFHVDDVIYVADTTANTMTAINALSLKVMGQTGSPAITGRGAATFNQPGGVAVIGERLYFADSFNHRVIQCARYIPNVEPGTGRLTFMIPPPDTHNAEFHASYNPYQGVWHELAQTTVYGRNFIQDDNTLYVTTMGRGTPSLLIPEGGMGLYANMISRLPASPEPYPLAPRVTDAYIFSPEPLPITQMTGGTPFVKLPVINRYPASAQYANPLYGYGSMYDYNRLLFFRGPGMDWPTGTDFLSRGYLSKAAFPTGDILETFPIQALSIPRVIFATALVELQGQIYLAIYSTYAAHSANKINDGFTSVDMYRVYGNCGIKPRY